MEFTEIRPDVTVEQAEFARLLGYPPEKPLTDRAAELAWQARAWYRREGRPWMYGRLARSSEIRGEETLIEGTGFAGPALRDRLGACDAHGTCLVAVGAGPELEARARALWLENRPDEYFFLETYGAAIVESLMTAAARRLDAWAATRGWFVTPHVSPGYPGWDVAEQGRLLSVLTQTVAAPWPGSVDALESGALRPTKSQLAVFGLTGDARRAGRRTVPCDTCLESCDVRRHDTSGPARPHPSPTGRIS